MNNSKILLVEDSRSIAQHIVRILSAKDFTVTTAEDGQEAWEILSAGNNDFEVIVLDREMPRLNGIELLKKLKATPSLSQIPVVMATSLADEQSMREGLAAGAYYYLAKPFVPEVLTSIVQAAMDQGREYRNLCESARQAERPFAFMESGVFRFQSLDDGKMLANSLARACPEPEKSVLGLQEIIVNAVEHGNLGISYDEKSSLLMNGQWLNEVNRRLSAPEARDKYVIVKCERTPDCITITIQDQGKGFDWQKYIDFDAERAFDNHGRGIAIAHKFSFDAVQYFGNGNTVVATIKLAGRPG